MRLGKGVVIAEIGLGETIVPRDETFVRTGRGFIRPAIGRQPSAIGTGLRVRGRARWNQAVSLT